METIVMFLVRDDQQSSDEESTPMLPVVHKKSQTGSDFIKRISLTSNHRRTSQSPPRSSRNPSIVSASANGKQIKREKAQPTSKIISA